MTTLYDDSTRVKAHNRLFGLGLYPQARDNTQPPRVGYNDADYAWYLANVAAHEPRGATDSPADDRDAEAEHALFWERLQSLNEAERIADGMHMDRYGW